MGNITLDKKLVDDMAQHGYTSRIVPIHILDNLRQSIEDQYRNGLFDEEFHQERLTGFVFQPPETLPNTQSIIVVAVPQPQVQITFIVDGQPLQTIVPPTYLHWQKTDQQVQDTLSAILNPQGYQVASVVLPKKLLAASSGLVTYGKNNITYVDGMGSFHRLEAFYSDMPCEENQSQELKMMARCENCHACIRICPTGAINPDRFLLHAERCLVFLNEKSGDIPFPAWCEPGWHNCLVGCMQCQLICPENKKFTGWIEQGETFTTEETAHILAGTPADQLPPALREKLEFSDLLDMLDILPRNINALIKS